MRTPKIILGVSILSLALGAGPLAMAQSSQTKPDSTKPDNTKPDNTRVNKRDQNPGESTADQQKSNVRDRDMASAIRKAITSDKSLSTYAHNVKVISQGGTVTLKGPVRSEEEVKSIMAKATEVAGSPDRVVNQMEVKPPKS
jgi:osmotically-inducible protein OsmY